MKRKTLRGIAIGVAAAVGLVLLPAAGASAATVTTNGNIYYGSGYTLKADGSASGIPKYAGATMYDDKLSFSPDGTRMVLRSQAQSGAPTTILTANADFTNRKTIVTASQYGFVDADSPDWSPNGQKIAVALFGESSSRIAVVNPDGSGLKQLANTTDLSSYRNVASWYPDSTRLIYINNVNQLCTVSIASTQKTCSNLPKKDVTGAPFDQVFSAPQLSPDGKFVAMTLYKGEVPGTYARYDVARTTPTGTGFVNLTAAQPVGGQYINPVWSPDGTTIAVGSLTAAGTGGVGLMTKDGANFRITGGNNGNLAWQPKQITVGNPSALAVTRTSYCGNDGGYYSWLALKATWQAEPKTVVSSYRIYENGTLLKTVTNTLAAKGALASTFSSRQWAANTEKTLVYTVKGVTAAGAETSASNAVTIVSPPYDC